MTIISTLIDFADADNSAAPRLRHAFGRPCQVMVAHELVDVRPLLDAVQSAALQGRWCVGYLRYEAAPAFDSALAVHAPEGPLAWFAVYDKVLSWPQGAGLEAPTPATEWLETCTRQVFDAAVSHIQNAIAAGELYQVNFTAQLAGTWQDKPTARSSLAQFAALQRAQPGGYAAFIDTGDAQVLSVSPELFFDWKSSHAGDSGQILARPMKGTALRGYTPDADAALAAALRASPKERAENVMIVDLLRNDLGRTCRTGSVSVPELFSLESYPNVHHLVSSVIGTLADDKDALDLIAGSFPGGSITGAPKIRAMQIIDELEPTRRGLYCGSLMYLDVRGEMDSSIAIRSLLVKDGQVCCWGGGGIVADSQWEAEYQESLTKVRVLLRTLEGL